MTIQRKVQVAPADLERVMLQLATALQEGIAQQIPRGLFHAPATDHDALWLATNLLGKAEEFAHYRLTFYHKGLGEGTDTCAVVFEQGGEIGDNS